MLSLWCMVLFMQSRVLDQSYVKLNTFGTRISNKHTEVFHLQHLRSISSPYDVLLLQKRQFIAIYCNSFVIKAHPALSCAHIRRLIPSGVITKHSQDYSKLTLIFIAYIAHA